MKIAVIGAQGFIGKAVVKEAIIKGHKVVCISRNIERKKKSSIGG